MYYRRFLLVAIVFFAASDVWCNNSSDNFSGETFVPLETLYYKLSYRGLLTSMFWAELADIKMTSIVHNNPLEETKYHQYELYLSTEHYRKAEIFHSVRYTYRSTIDNSLQRTVLVEEMDKGDNNSYDTLWLDWNNKTIHLFEKSKNISTKRLPEALKNSLLSDVQGVQIAYNTKLAYKKQGDKIRYEQVLDPLSLLYFLRTINFRIDNTFSETIREKEFPIVVSDDIRLYRVEKLLPEVILLNGKNVQTIKLKIITNEKRESRFYVWLSNDKHKTPIRMSMDAPLGNLEIKLVKIKH